MNQEQIYDKEISPLMVQIIEICKKNNITMYADFRLKEIGCKTLLRFDDSMIMKIYEIAGQCQDDLSFQLDKFLLCLIKNFDLRQSMFSKIPLGEGKIST